MFQMFMQFPLALVGAFAVMLLGHAQDQSGFISIDCGLQQKWGYTEGPTTIRYIPDTNYIDTGESKTISNDYVRLLPQQFRTVRIFPKGTRNCYKINVTSGQKYLIRASFGYGNYDGENNLPEFELRLGDSLWDSVVFTRDPMNSIIAKELIHIPMRNYIHVCLVDINKGVPFISVIELRPLRDEIYQSKVGSLTLIQRCDTGRMVVSDTGGIVVSDIIYRYPDDVIDRLWYRCYEGSWKQLSTSSVIDRDAVYQLPSRVMSTAATPIDISSKYLNFSFMPAVIGKNLSFYIYMHFAEVRQYSEVRQDSASWSRELTITMNGKPISSPFDPHYLSTTTRTTTFVAEEGKYDFSISTPGTTFQPILNALEIYMAKEILVSETNQQDVEAITNLKSTYKIIKNWQGDPCNPQVYLWEGVKCSYSDNDSARIISLDLSQSGLTGEIAASIANLTMIQTLDLSNNNLSGQIPLSQLPKLNVLNLEKNGLTGSVPAGLIAKGKDGLSLSLCGNPSLSKQVPCEKKKNKFAVPIVLSIIVMLLVSSIAAAILWKLKKGHAVWKYWRVDKGHDVFLSFRGEDTRQGFARNLYEALEKEGIKTFFDDEKLQAGDEIALALLNAIEASKISVIILSKDYASSRWCLSELVKILDCKRSKHQRVIPVFYNVDPSHVRRQSGSFSLEKWTGKKEVPAWRKALTEVGSLSGFHYTNGYESKLIGDIVKKISDVNEQKKKKEAGNSVDGFDKISPQGVAGSVSVSETKIDGSGGSPV